MFKKKPKEEVKGVEVPEVESPEAETIETETEEITEDQLNEPTAASVTIEKAIMNLDERVQQMEAAFFRLKSI